MWYPEEVGLNFRGHGKRTLIYLCCYTRLWIRRDSLSVHVTPLETERSDGTARISKVGIFNGDKRTQGNPNTQGDGWLDFFIKVFYNTTLTLLQ